MKLEHRQNLADLADWLEAHAVDEAMGMTNFPKLLKVGTSVREFSMHTYSDLRHEYSAECGSSGCAIGWATYAIEPRDALDRAAGQRSGWRYEGWPAYAKRLFGCHDDDSDIGTFMFDQAWGDWPNEATATAAVARIRAVLHSDGELPSAWPHWDDERMCVKEYGDD